MAGAKPDKAGSDDSSKGLDTLSAPSPASGTSLFHPPGPLGLLDHSSVSGGHPLAPACRHRIVAFPTAPSEDALDFAPQAQHPVLTAYTLRVLRSILRAAGLSRAQIISTARTPADDARVAFGDFEKQDFTGSKRAEAMKDPLTAVYLEATDDDESPDEAVDDLQDKLMELGPLYSGKFRRPGTLLDVVNIAPQSIRSREALLKAVRDDSRVENLLCPPLSPHYHLEIPQPRAAGSGKDGTGDTPDAPPPPPKAKSKTWVEFKVVEDGTGKPVGGVRLRVTTPDGIENFYTADSAGLIRIEDLDPGQCDIGEMIDADALEVVSLQ